MVFHMSCVDSLFRVFSSVFGFLICVGRFWISLSVCPSFGFVSVWCHVFFHVTMEVSSLTICDVSSGGRDGVDSRWNDLVIS